MVRQRGAIKGATMIVIMTGALVTVATGVVTTMFGEVTHDSYRTSANYTQTGQNQYQLSS